MDKRKVTLAEALYLLNEGEQIHTFRNTAGMLIGADHSRKSLLSRMEKHCDTLEIAGNLARRMKHGLILTDDSGFLFIETDEEKLNVFDPILIP